MDVGTANGWRLDEVVPAADIISLVGGQWPLEPLAPGCPGEVAARYRYRDGMRQVDAVELVASRIQITFHTPKR